MSVQIYYIFKFSFDRNLYLLLSYQTVFISFNVTFVVSEMLDVRKKKKDKVESRLLIMKFGRAQTLKINHLLVAVNSE